MSTSNDIIRWIFIVEWKTFEFTIDIFIVFFRHVFSWQR